MKNIHFSTKLEKKLEYFFKRKKLFTEDKNCRNKLLNIYKRLNNNFS